MFTILILRVSEKLSRLLHGGEPIFLHIRMSRCLLSCVHSCDAVNKLKVVCVVVNIFQEVVTVQKQAKRRGKCATNVWGLENFGASIYNLNATSFSVKQEAYYVALMTGEYAAECM